MRYGRTLTALRGVSLQVPDGAAVAVLGANGAGKSTLMRALSGTLGHHRGTVDAGPAAAAGAAAAVLAGVGLLLRMAGTTRGGANDRGGRRFHRGVRRSTDEEPVPGQPQADRPLPADHGRPERRRPDRLVKTLSENRLSFGSAERLSAALGLEPGVVSPFGLIDPNHREVSLLFDTEMLRDDILTFLDGLSVEYRTIDA